jgi:hypothetical protein
MAAGESKTLATAIVLADLVGVLGSPLSPHWVDDGGAAE